MIVFENAKKTYATGRPAVDDVSFTIPRGQFCVLLGHSGAGKSTLLRLVNGLTELTSGGITVDGLAISKSNLGLIRKKVSMIHQGFNLSQRSSVAVNVMSGALADVSWFRAMAGAFPSSIRGKACEALNRVGLREEHLQRRVDSLSGGQQQRVGIARALIMDPIVMLADEPISSLDPSTSRDILRLLRDAAKERTCTVLCSLHQVDLAKEFADRIIGIDAGRVVFDLRPEEVAPEVLSLIYRNYEDPLGVNTLASCSLENLVEPSLRSLS